ncbi:MAG: GNAT family N-acetyltransferase, partial [FCB group bacterium]|nr:GNAT family N-acetyltransferase [FCB group bacterium]
MNTSPQPRCKIYSADEADPQQLKTLLDSCFAEEKSDFLRSQGSWYCNGRENQYVIATSPSEYVGYFALIPARLRVDEEVFPGAWLIDIYVLREHRVRRYESAADAFMREKYGLLIGFPNILAAKIHKKHGWGVRDDLKLQMFPLQPLKIPLVREARGLKGAVLKAAALLGTPLLQILKLTVSLTSTHGITKTQKADPDVLAALDSKMPVRFRTIVRDRSYFQWRFLSAPHADQFKYYLAQGETGELELGLITRTFTRDGVTITRIVDLIGAVTNAELLKRAVGEVLRDAAKAGSAYVSVISSLR